LNLRPLVSQFDFLAFLTLPSIASRHKHIEKSIGYTSPRCRCCATVSFPVATRWRLSKEIMPHLKLGRRTLATIPAVEKATVYYDTELTGFGLKAYPSGARSWIVEYRPGAGGRGVSKRRMVLGTPKTLTPDEARNLASGVLAQVRLGADPAGEKTASRRAESVRDILDVYLDHARSLRKPSTAALYKLYIDKHLAPALGAKKAVNLRRDEVVRFHRSIGKNHPATANRVIAILSAAYNFGINSEMLPKGTANPAAGIEKFKEQSRERYLLEAELLRLGDAIREAETGIPWPSDTPQKKHAPKKPENRVTKIGPHAAAALRLLIFTGARLREILHLQWDHVDLQRGLLLLPTSKTGKKTIVLSDIALAIIIALPRVGRFVIAGNDNDKPRSDLQRPWSLVSKRADLSGVRLHDLRHSFASVGVGSGMGLPIIGKLLGHANAATTERYAHLAADPLRRASDAISGAIAKAMGDVK
jgi:integrase